MNVTPPYLQALAAIETLRPEDIPSEQDLEIIESYLTSAEDFLAAVRAAGEGGR
jgi:hypothetical protein